MFEKIAVVGTGVIGTLAGGFLTLGGYDVTVVPCFRRNAVEKLRTDGITILYEGETLHTPVKAEFIDDIPADEKFDLVLITGKSNDTETMTRKMLPHMTETSVISSLQNGINEDRIIPLAGAERVVPCVCFTGGFSAGPGQVENHPGFLLVGELDGSDTPRVRELAKVIGAIKPTEVSDNIMLKRWEKLAEICMGVPLACASGYHQFCGNDDKRMQRLFARIACETFRVARAAGYELEKIGFMTEAEVQRLAVRDDEELGERMAHHPMAQEEPPEGATGLAALVDAYTADIRKGAPLEIGYANGYIIQKGRELGVPVPTHEAVVDMVYEIEKGQRRADKSNLDELIAMTDKYYL
ncbi:MAG: ketopantoate reductase family protein [Oscillospiraceae bacterium]